MAVAPDAVEQRPAEARSPAGTRRPPLGRLGRLRHDWGLLLFAAPGLILLLMFHYVPLLGNVIAFQDYQPYLGISGSDWVGFSNFDIIFNGDPAFINALKNTLILTVIQVVIVFPIPIALALLLNSVYHEKMKRLVQSILYLPHFLSWVIVVALFQQMFGNAGLINTFLAHHDWRLAAHRRRTDLLQDAHHLAGDLEGHRLGHDPVPRGPLPDRHGAVRSGLGRRRQQAASRCGTSRCPGCARSSSCC